MIKSADKVVANALASASVYNNPEYRAQKGMGALEKMASIFDPKVAKMMVEDAIERGVKVPDKVMRMYKSGNWRLANSRACNASTVKLHRDDIINKACEVEGLPRKDVILCMVTPSKWGVRIAWMVNGKTITKNYSFKKIAQMFGGELVDSNGLQSITISKNSRVCNDEFPNKPGTWAIVKRPNGGVETIDLSKRFFGMNPQLARRIKEDTKRAGKGEVVKIVSKDWKTNAYELEKQYARDFLEGGEGYIPDMTKSPKFKKYLEVKVFNSSVLNADFKVGDYVIGKFDSKPRKITRVDGSRYFWEDSMHTEHPLSNPWKMERCDATGKVCANSDSDWKIITPGKTVFPKGESGDWRVRSKADGGWICRKYGSSRNVFFKDNELRAQLPFPEGGRNPWSISQSQYDSMKGGKFIPIKVDPRAYGFR